MFCAVSVFSGVHFAAISQGYYFEARLIVGRGCNLYFIDNKKSKIIFNFFKYP